jgi:hypothetical protein
MVTRKELLQALRGGTFVPFPFLHTNLDINSQLREFACYLQGQDLIDSFLYIFKQTEQMPNNLTPKERLFCRSLRNGLIDLKATGRTA